MALKERRQLSVYEAIYHRRMAWKFEDKPVPASTIEQMLDAAVWAPNHRLTEPWRFFVLDKDSPARRLAADMARQTMLDRSGDERRADAGRDKMLETPCLMYVYSVPGRDEAETKENYAAVCCAVQNMALAGANEGVAVTWETGGITRAGGVRELLGADPSWDLVTILLIGYPDEHPHPRRTPATKFVKWLKRHDPAVVG